MVSVKNHANAIHSQDGLTCTRKIRELEQEGKLTGHVPIIAVTANARAEQVQTALNAGMVRSNYCFLRSLRGGASMADTVLHTGRRG